MAAHEGHTFFEGRITVVFNDAGFAADIGGDSPLNADALRELACAAVAKKLSATAIRLN